MRESKTKVIGDIEYKVAQFNPTIALRLQLWLSKKIGPALATIAYSDGVGTAPAAGEQGQEFDLAAGVTILAQAIDLDKDIDVIKSMFSQTSIGGRALDFDRDFQGKIFDIYKLMFFVAEVNFPDFFDPMLAAFAKLRSSEHVADISVASEVKE